MNAHFVNRLWVRLSLTISTVFVTAVLLVSVSGFLLRPEMDVQFEDLPQETQQILSTVVNSFLRSLAALVISGAILGIIASIWLSRRLTKPLEELATGAHEIGSRNLAYRVPVSGSYELQVMANSFNGMAEELGEAEQSRRALLADVAHELRTPLTVLEGNLRAILDDVYKLDKIEVAGLYDQTRQLRHMVNDLHELAQAEARQLPLDCQSHNVVELVHAAAEIFDPLAEAQSVQLQTELPTAPLSIHADHTRVMQVLQNLLNNALRHTPSGGSITMRVLPQHDYVAIDVQDNGDGIAPEHLHRVFNRFYRADKARDRDAGGAGLGLAIVRALVEAHDGSVDVVSPGLGLGSTFTVLLPRG